MLSQWQERLCGTPPVEPFLVLVHKLRLAQVEAALSALDEIHAITCQALAQVAAIREHEVALTRALVEGLANIPGVTVHGPADPTQRTATLSFTMAGRRVSEIGLRLDEEHDVLCLVGLHCAPAAHRTIGTFPEGTVRLAAGLSTTMEDVQWAVVAVARIVTDPKGLSNP